MGFPMTRESQTSTVRTGEPAWTSRDLAENPHNAEDKPERVQRMFAAIAHRYDLNNRLHSFGRDQVWRRGAVKMAAPQKTDRVLDVASGTGDLAEAFADAGVSDVIGLDFTQRMLDMAEVKARNRKRGAGVCAPTYVQGDAMDLPFEDETFDIVSIAFGIRNVSDPAKAVGEFHRVLRPGGRLVILEFAEPRNPIIRLGNRIYCKWIMPFTATLISRDRSGAYYYLPRSVETFLEPQRICAMLRECGFGEPVIQSMTFGVCVAYCAAVPGG
jgi:demethylmenaquinone methyltransferase / 2-methoxy-6-polyprenyl-1,4-benzoquinol methylase